MAITLCFGDSLAFGIGETPCKGWAGRFKEWYEKFDSHHQVYPLGIPADTSSDLLKRFEAECSARLKGNKAQLIIICIGGNDTKWKGLPNEGKAVCSENLFRKNIKKLVGLANKYSLKTIVIGLPFVDEKQTIPHGNYSFVNSRIREFDKILKEESDSANCLFIDTEKALADASYEKHISDGLHPNRKGYDLLFSVVRLVIEKFI